MELTIECPQCHHQFGLSDALVAKLREEIAAETREQARDAFGKEKADLLAQLEEKASQLRKAQDAELKLRKRQRELQARADSIDLEIERRLDEERTQIEKGVLARLEEEHRLKDAQKEQFIKRLQSQIEDLKRRAEQGPQQAQGDAAEAQLEDLLRAEFPFDQIAPVGTGVRGADVIQTVLSEMGDECGSIIWESKDTKHWNHAWISKLKDDQLEAKADIAVIVSTALPDDVTTLTYQNSVWIASFQCVVGLATSLRANLIQVHRAQTASAGKEEKVELLYNYLAGTEFKQRVEAMAEAFTSMQKDLASERRAMERAWAKRTKQIDRFVKNVAGMYGDVQGIIGAAVPDLPQLGLPTDEEMSALAEGRD